MSDLKDKNLYVRLASMSEAIDILTEPQIVERVGRSPASLERQPWIIECAGTRMLFMFWQLGSVAGVYDVHIACPHDSILASRVLAKGVQDWLFSNGAVALVTGAPEGKITNMLKKLSWTEIARKDNLVYFMLERG